MSGIWHEAADVRLHVVPDALTFLRLANRPGIFVCYMSSDDPRLRMTQVFG